MPFLAAHVPIGALICGSVIDTRAMYGDLVVITDVAAFKMIIGFLACVAMSATASASGVRPKPARKSTLSRTTSSCARRLATSGDGPVGVADDDLDLASRDRVAVDLLERLDAGVELLAVVGERTGKRRDDADLDRILRPGRQRDEQAAECHKNLFHE